jgi:hypothetical protein
MFQRKLVFTTGQGGFQGFNGHLRNFLQKVSPYVFTKQVDGGNLGLAEANV